MFITQESIDFLKQVESLRSAGTLALATFGPSIDPKVSQASTPGQPPRSGWMLETYLNDPKFRAIMKTGLCHRFRMMHGKDADDGDWTFLMTIADIGHIQHRLILPLIGRGVRAMLADVASGAFLGMSYAPSKSRGGVVMRTEEVEHAAEWLVPMVRSAHSSPMDITRQALLLGVEATKHKCLPGEAEEATVGRELLVSVCLPEEVIASAAGVIGGAAGSKPTLN